MFELKAFNSPLLYYRMMCRIYSKLGHEPRKCNFKKKI